MRIFKLKYHYPVLSFSMLSFLLFYSRVYATEQKVNFDSNLSAFSIETQFKRPDFTQGISGKAWRTDGFSSFATLELSQTVQTNFSIGTWVAIESYPSDAEVTVDNLTPSAFFYLPTENGDISVFIDTFGRWGISATQGNETVRAYAEKKFPTYSWAHIALTINVSQREATLYFNGNKSGLLNLPDKVVFNCSEVVFAKPRLDKQILNFKVNWLNGAFDDINVIHAPLDKTRLEKWLDVNTDATALQALAVPLSRFEDDHLRPAFHAMPPANWTNEPHGLVRKNGRWHMFYQRTPNGPYKTQMHWGHMLSDDLVRWTNVQDALWPELQNENFGFDMKGIWSGDVIVEDDVGFAFYTSVNHFDRLKAANPGISMAISTDENLLYWEKKGPIINTEHVKDFRDPYLWREDDSWHMIIGAAYEGYGGLDYYVLDLKEQDKGWRHKRQFSDIAYRLLDIGSDIWEMPVFEPLDDETHVLVVNPIGGDIQKYGEPATRGVYWTGKWENGVFSPNYKEPKMLDIIVGHLSPTVARADDNDLRAIGIVDERRSSQAQENAGWTHTFSLPRRWFLMPDKKTLGQAPAPELGLLRQSLLREEETLNLSNSATNIDAKTNQYELLLDGIEWYTDVLTISLMKNKLNGEQTSLSFNNKTGEIRLDKSLSNSNSEDEGPQVLSGNYDADAFGEIEKVRVFVDGSVVDVFINDSAAFSFRVYPSSAESSAISITAEESAVLIGKLALWQMQNK